MDPELEALRRARMAQMQGGGGEQAQQVFFYINLFLRSIPLFTLKKFFRT